MSDTPSVEVRGLTKLYGELQALHGLSFTVQPGQIVGFLGPNGAGKSTTMKILTGFMSATSGTAKVAGFDVQRQSKQVRQRIGYLPERVPLYEDMLVYDYLMFMAELRGVSSTSRAARVGRVAELTGLSARMGQAIGELSRGFRQRVGLAQAIVHEPEVIILDEPMSGLDPNQIIEIRDLITQIGQEKTVLFSTHIMQEVSAVCDRVIIISQGRIVADDTVPALASQLVADRPGLLARLDARGTTTARLTARVGKCPHADAVAVERERDDEVTLHVHASNPEALRRELFKLAAEDDLPLKALTPYEPDLEAIFRHHTTTVTERT